MDELLNKYGLPNDNGFIINGSMFRKFFDNDEDYLNFEKELISRVNHIRENYDIDSLEIPIDFSMAVQFVNGSKKFVLNKEDLLNSIESYFTPESISTLPEKTYILFDEKKEKVWLAERINVIKQKISKSIGDLKEVKTIDDLKKYQNVYIGII